MIQLVQMNETDFAGFMEVSKASFCQDQVLAGQWKADEAAQNMEKLSQQILPNGLATLEHEFFVIKAADSVVGGLWFMIEEEDGKRQIFVMDIQVYPEHRRHGYGYQAFLAMEEKAREMGLDTISLHVAMHNHQARAMYKKLGYLGEDTMMWKKVAEK